MTARHLPALGFDPCPGDVAGCRSLAATLRGLTARLGAAGHAAREDAGAWEGPASRAHRERVAALPTALRLVAVGVVGAADVVDAWAAALALLQREADLLEVRMAAATQEVGRVSGAVAVAQRLAGGGGGPAVDPLARAREVAGATARLDAAAAVAAGVAAEARRLHERYAEEEGRAAQRLAAATAEGLRAPWAGQGGGPVGAEDGSDVVAADGGTVRPGRTPVARLRREVWEDGVGEHVHVHAADYAAVSRGSAAVSTVLAPVPLAPAQVGSRAAAVVGGASDAVLGHFVEHDTGAALGGVAAVGLAGTGGAVARAAAASPGRAATTSSEVGLETGTAVVGVATAVPRSAVPPWERPDHLGAARRTSAEQVRRADGARAAAGAARRAREVERCVRRDEG